MERIGIIGALDEEVADLKKLVKDRNDETIAGMQFTTGTIHGKSVAVVRCGMGKVNAGICAQLLISEFKASKIIFTGVAGALDSVLKVGDIVVSKDAVQHDYDLTPIGYKPGQIDQIGVYMKADQKLAEMAVNTVKQKIPEIHVYEGTIVSGDQFIHTESQKKQITSSFKGMCCEVEGAAVAQACVLNQVPFVIIRSISDSADGSSSISYETFMKDAAKHGERITESMLAQM